jgi:hypothetical protein
MVASVFDGVVSSEPDEGGLIPTGQADPLDNGREKTIFDRRRLRKSSKFPNPFGSVWPYPTSTRIMLIVSPFVDCHSYRATALPKLTRASMIEEPIHEHGKGHVHGHAFFVPPLRFLREPRPFTKAHPRSFGETTPRLSPGKKLAPTIH